MVLKVSEFDQKMVQSHTVLLRIEIFLLLYFMLHVCYPSKRECLLHPFQYISNVTI